MNLLDKSIASTVRRLKLNNLIPTHTNQLTVRQYDDGNALIAINGKHKKYGRQEIFMVLTQEQIKILKEFLK